MKALIKLARKQYEHPLSTVGRHAGKGALAGLGVAGVAKATEPHAKAISEAARQAKSAAKGLEVPEGVKETGRELGEKATSALHEITGHPMFAPGVGAAAVGAGLGAARGLRRVLKATKQKEQEEAARRQPPAHAYPGY